jgi:DNA-binding transcriptional LysR family regulator
MALNGVGIIRVSDHVVADDLAAGRLIPVLAEHQPPQRETLWAIHSSRDLSQRVRVFIDYLTMRLKD